MILLETPGFTVTRENRFLGVHFQGPWRTLSTCPVHGGEQENLVGILNCQTCEGSAHHPKAKTLHKLSREELHQECCLAAGAPADLTALLGTAANMDYASIQSESFEDAQVTAIATAGVEGNAGRAGDPAQWHEGEHGYVPVHAVPGTINIILLFHQPVSRAALARSVVTLTEAKSAALLDLSIGSRYSANLATGTGTDQYAVASPLAEPARFHWTGNHAKLGELVGKAVHAAVLEALRWQNGLEPSRTRNLFHALKRFGLREEQLRSALQAQEQKEFLLDSLTMVAHDPRVSAAAYALAGVLDRERAGTLPPDSAQEAIRWQLALLAASVAGKPEQFATHLASIPLQSELPELLAHAIGIGWREKWM